MFRPARIDRQFRRFLRTGDTRALGAVFDAAAPELLKIAAYLSGARQQAEDLVQSTFLVALEKQHEFDSDRQVMPWLCGIVANLARAERRRAARSRGDTDDVSEVDAADGAAAAEFAEFRAAFTRARDGLSETLRPVLELYLDHGLRANEIARVLGRPAGTVRAQVSRGLEELRRRLPRGFVAGLAIAAIAPTALPAMRATVMAHAGACGVEAVAAAPWSLALIGGGIMNKKIVVAAAVASVLAFGTWLVQSAGSGAGTSPESPSTKVLATADLDRRALATEAPIESERSPLVTDSSAAVAAGGSIELTARWQADGAPAVRQIVEVVCAAEQLGELRPRRALTDDHGRCVIEDVPPGAVAVFASTGDHVETVVSAGTAVPLTLELKSWGRVRGLVVDPAGAPVADAEVWLSSEVRYRPRGRGANAGHGQYGGFVARSDAEGRFALRLGFMQCLAAFKAGYGPSRTVYPCIGQAPPDGAEVTLQLSAAAGTLAVDVRDANGAPIAGACVLAGPEVPYIIAQAEATPPALRATTDEHGHAELRRLPAGEVPVQVRAVGFAPWHGKQQLPADGVANLPVQLEAGATVEGIVVDADGTAIPGATIAHGSICDLASSSCQSGADGTFELHSLPAGTVELAAWLEGVGTCRVELTLVAGGRQVWRPVLTVRPAITGIVLDPAGQPLVGAHVFCFGGERGGRNANGVTDDRGRFALGPLDEGARYSVRAEFVRPRVGLLQVVATDVAPESDIVLNAVGNAERTAHLRGRLLTADGTPATQVQMLVQPVDGGMGHAMSLDQDGVFTSGPDEPGRIRITVMSRHMRTVALLGEHQLRAHETLDLGDVLLPTPGGLALRITGGDVVKGAVDLFLGEQMMDSRRLEAPEISWDDLPPGDYRLRVRRGGAMPLIGSGTCSVASGTTTRAELCVRPAEWRVLRFDVTGECPLPGTLVVVDGSGAELLRDRIAIAADGEGDKILLPTGRLQLRFSTPDGWSGEAPVTVPGEEPIVLRLVRH